MNRKKGILKKLSDIRLVWLILPVLFLMNCSSADAKDNQEKQKEVSEEKALVTFIELGSVRCVPCRMMQPIMDEIKKEYAGQVKVVFHDVWTKEGSPFAGQYRIRVIPTQVFLDKDGREYFRHEGFFPKEELIEILKRQGVK